MTKRAAIYCRISRDREGAGLGVTRQEADCRALATQLGWTVAPGHVHVDNDLSAYSGKRRPGYETLLNEVRAGEVDGVITWHTDRLHRSPVELEAYAAACEEHRVVTQTVRAGSLDLSTAAGLMVARMLGATARYEVDHSIERQKRAKEAAATAGKWRGGRRPYGYEADGMTVRQDEADAVAEATSALLAGASLRSVVADWNVKGRRTTTGGPWATNGLRVTVRRARNAGLIEHHGKIVGPANWPAIVPEPQWRALIDFLDRPDRRSNVGAPARRWLGSGLYRCECGETVICGRSNGDPAYRCRDGCGRLSRRQGELDSFISELLVRRLRQADLADLIHRDGPDRAAELDREAVALRSRLDSLTALFTDGQVDAQQLAQGSAELRRRLTEVQAEQAAAYSGTALAGVADAPDPGAAWLGTSLDRQRAVLDAVMQVTLIRGAAGRPTGWTPGSSYFRPDLISITWR